jgi:hypothetical protein
MQKTAKEKEILIFKGGNMIFKDLSIYNNNLLRDL